MAKKYLTLEEAAERLGLSTDQLMRLREKGEIRGFADRGSWKFKEQEIEEFARRQEVDSAPDVQIVAPTAADSSAGEEDLDLSASDSDVRLAFDDSVFDSNPELPVADSDVQLADDSAVDAADSSGAAVLDFDDSSDAANSDSDVTFVKSDSDSDVTMVGAGTDPDIELVSSGTELPADDSSVILTGSETDADIELSSTLFEDGDSDPDSDVLLVDSDSDIRLTDEPSQSDKSSATPAEGDDSESEDSSAFLSALGLDSDSSATAAEIGDDDAILQVASDSELVISDSDSDVRLSDEPDDTAKGPKEAAADTPSDVVMVPDSAAKSQGSGPLPEINSDSDVHLVDAPGLTEDDSDSDVVISSGLDSADSGIRLDDDVFDDATDDEYVENATVAMALPSGSDVRPDAEDFDDSATAELTLPEDSDLKLIDAAGSSSDSSEISLNFDDTGITLDADESGVSLEVDDSGISLEVDDSGISLEAMDSSATLLDDGAITLDAGDSGISLEAADSGIALFDDDSGITLEGMDDMGSTQPMTSAGGTANPLSQSGSDTLHMEMPDDDAGHDSEFELAGLDDDDDDFGTDTSVLMFDDGDDDDDDDGDDLAVAAIAADTDDDAFEDDLVDDLEEGFDDDEMDDVWDAEEDDDDHGFDAGESKVGDDTATAAGAATAGVGLWVQEQPWGALWTSFVSIGALLSVFSALVGIELVRTMWLWTQPGEHTSGLLGMLGGMFGK
ncbi:MAG: helix-turn-helix domain-containing protein [Fuerstiella sp.]